ncbi:hypothetical protein ACQ4M4_25890 [Leptolyngbya sp. AN02str]|uniref:hypothetical protein n=1 Tax=Leptolyngbya sp. AN02str TaxID=3423363 RepID=UPI003D322604
MNEERVREIVREVLIEMIAPGLQPSDDGWQDATTAWEVLGYPSYDALYKDIQAGLLRQGKEVFDRRKPGARKARWTVDVAAAKRRLAENPENRRGI